MTLFRLAALIAGNDGRCARRLGSAVLVVLLVLTACAEPEPQPAGARDVESSVLGPEIEISENGWGLVSVDTGDQLRPIIEPSIDPLPKVLPGTRLVSSVVDIIPPEPSSRGYWAAADGSLVAAANPELVSAVIFDADYGIWIPLRTEYLPDSDSYRFFSPHFTRGGFFEWVDEKIVQPVADGVSGVAEWTAERVKNLVDRAWDAVLATSDALVEGYEFVRDVAVGWLGIGGAEPPVCGSPPDSSEWEFYRSSKSDDALYSCADQVDGQIVVRLANNRPYGMIVSFDGTRATGQNTSWPSLSVFSGQRGFHAFYDVLQDVVTDVFDTDLEMAYLPPGGGFDIAIDPDGVEESIRVEVTSDPSLTAFDLIATLLWEIWGSSVELGSLLLLDCGGKVLQAVRNLGGDVSAVQIGKFLNSSFESFVACAKAADLKTAGLVVDFARDALKTIIALGRNLWDTDWSDRTLDRSVALVRAASDGSSAEPAFDSTTDAAILGKDSFAGVSFREPAAGAVDHFESILGIAHRDSGWIVLPYWTEVNDNGNTWAHDAPHPVDSLFLAPHATLRVMCWDDDAVGTCVFLNGASIAKAAVTGWEQASFTYAVPTVAGDIPTTDNGWRVGFSGEEVAATATLAGGEGNALLFVHGALSGRLEGSMTVDGIVTLGDSLYCITAGPDRPRPGFGQLCMSPTALPRSVERGAFGGNSPSSQLSIEEFARDQILHSLGAPPPPEELAAWLDYAVQSQLPNMDGRAWTRHNVLCTSTGFQSRYHTAALRDVQIAPYLWENAEDAYSPDLSEQPLVEKLEGLYRDFGLYLIADTAEFGGSGTEQMLDDPNPRYWPVPEDHALYRVRWDGVETLIFVDANLNKFSMPPVSLGVHRYILECLDDPTAYDHLVPEHVLALVNGPP